MSGLPEGWTRRFRMTESGGCYAEFAGPDFVTIEVWDDNTVAITPGESAVPLDVMLACIDHALVHPVTIDWDFSAPSSGEVILREQGSDGVWREVGRGHMTSINQATILRTRSNGDP